MKSRWLSVLTAGLLLLAQAACGAPASPGVVTQGSTNPLPILPAGTALSRTEAGPTSTPATRPATGADLSAAEMLGLLRSSFGKFPHRLRQTTLSKSNNQTATGLIEATDPDHIYIASS